MEKNKLEKILHYSVRPLNTFMQFDVFINAEPDDVVKPDEDGDNICRGQVEELMHGPSIGHGGVRVLISPDTTQIDALHALKKIRQWIKRDGIGTFIDPKIGFDNIPF